MIFNGIAGRATMAGVARRYHQKRKTLGTQAPVLDNVVYKNKIRENTKD
jgi:hypothetical protein